MTRDPIRSLLAQSSDPFHQVEPLVYGGQLPNWPVLKIALAKPRLSGRKVVSRMRWTMARPIAGVGLPRPSTI